MLDSIKKWAVPGIAGLVLLLGNWAQYRAGLRTATELGQVKAALALSDAALNQLRTLRAEEALLVAEAARREETLAREARTLEKQLREALRHAKDIHPDTVLPDSVSDALCLRWRAASGRDAGDAGNPAAGAHAGKNNPAAAFPVAARRREPQRALSDEPGRGDLYPGAYARQEAPCETWRGRVTLGDTVEWAGLLLDHAGLERLDKQALREWSKEASATP